MSLIDCPECGEEISDQAETCPHCGLPEPASEKETQNDQAGSEGEEAQDDGGQGCLLIITGLLAAFTLFGLLADANSTGGGSAGSEPTSTEAWTICQEFVEDRLEAPSTAEYPWNIDAQLQSRSGDRFTFDSYVDAENSFGAKVRTEFTCIVRHAGGDKWELENLDLRSR